MTGAAPAGDRAMARYQHINDIVAAAQRGDREALRFIDRLDDSEDSWRIRRRTGVGGSDVAAILGLDRFRRPIDVWRLKVGLDREEEAGPAAAVGRLLEPLIADWYQRVHADAFLEGPFRTGRHPDRPWHTFTLDRAVLRAPRARRSVALPRRESIVRVVEIKSRGFWREAEYGVEGTDEVPLPDLSQTAWYLAGVECDGGADLAVLSNTHRYREYHVPRDPQLEADLLEAVERWWLRHVVGREQPRPDGSPAFGRYLRERFGDVRGELLAPTAEDEALIESLRAVRALRSRAERADKLLTQRLLARLEHAPGFDLGAEGRVTARPQRGRVSESAVVAELARRLDMGPKQLEAIREENRLPAYRCVRVPAWGDDNLPAAARAVQKLLAAAPVAEAAEED
jgi:predicted phage-related endonuclease